MLFLDFHKYVRFMLRLISSLLQCIYQWFHDNFEVHILLEADIFACTSSEMH